VPGKIAARKITAPNSKVREFHVDRVCDVYSRYKRGFVEVGLVEGEGLREPVEGNEPPVVMFV
jgi:hypothetical protein